MYHPCSTRLTNGRVWTLMICRSLATPVGVIRAAGRAAKEHIISQRHKRCEFNADSIDLLEGSLDARRVNIGLVWLKKVFVLSFPFGKSELAEPIAAQRLRLGRAKDRTLILYLTAIRRFHEWLSHQEPAIELNTAEEIDKVLE